MGTRHALKDEIDSGNCVFFQVRVSNIRFPLLFVKMLMRVNTNKPKALEYPDFSKNDR